jgi:pyruvate dehydrogenase E1 component alpha subunit
LTGVRDPATSDVPTAPAGASSDAGAGADIGALMADMLIARRASERMWNLQRQGRVTTVAPIVGQEAAIVGVVRALDLAHDWVVPYYRDLLGFAALGDDYLESVFAYWRGHPDGGRAPDHAHVLPPQISLGAQIPHAAGLAWGLRLRDEPGVVVAFIGDGATSEGDFYEGLNLAGVQRAPLVVAVINNGWAISTPTTRQTAAASFASKAAAAGVPGERVDGNDVLAVHDAAVRARRHAATSGPIVLELVTYRMGAHTNSDDPTRYVPPEDLASWRERDPIEHFRARLTADGLWTDAAHQAVVDDVEARLERLVDAAMDRDVDPHRMFDHVFATDAPRITEQRADLAAHAGPDTPGARTREDDAHAADGSVSWRP